MKMLFCDGDNLAALLKGSQRSLMGMYITFDWSDQHVSSVA